MEWLKALPCLVLGGCSSFGGDGLLKRKTCTLHRFFRRSHDLKKAADQEKLGPPLEVAGPIAANPISPGPWIVCLKSDAPGQSDRPTCSVFFKGGKLSSVQSSAVIDHCESQVFRLFDSAWMLRSP
jgi:hypothetical protein